MLIGISGTDGAGKSTVVDYMVREHGYIHFSARGYLSEELHKRGAAVTRPALGDLACELRTLHGDDLIVAIALGQLSEGGKQTLIIDSIRTTAEVVTLKKAGGTLLVVDADAHVRYQRIVSRASATDAINFDQFVARETIEANELNPHGMQKQKVMEMAEYKILNNGTRTELEALVEGFLKRS